MASIDYSIYLVTGRELLPPGKDYYESLEESLQGGVTLVQIREKDTDKAEFIEIAAKSKVICDRHNVPIIINDRVDVAIEINARGVHVGQSDMPASQARKMLPKGMVIGVSCNNADEVKAAVRDGADYVGIGSVFGTKSKTLTNPLIGVRGVGPLLEILDGTTIKAVAIGGIKSTNLLRTLHGAVSSTDHPLDGVAVISDIVSSLQPRQATEKLSQIFKSFHINDTPSLLPSPQGVSPTQHIHDKVAKPTSPKPKSFSQKFKSFLQKFKSFRINDTPSLLPSPQSVSPTQYILDEVAKLMIQVRNINPLVHQITNTVVATQSANITLAIGGSPIMATAPQEMEDLAGICSALLINIGTLRSDVADSMAIAGRSANTNKKPVVFDPVGAGASTFRREIVDELLDTFQATVIKGNPGELAVIAKSQEVLTKGVDSVGSGFEDPVGFVKALAKKERCVVVMTGPVDYISDGTNTVALKNGDKMLGQITGSGCITGTSIATFCGTSYAQSVKDDHGKLVHGDMFLGAIAGVLVLTVAAEIAVKRPDVKGPGTFLPALIDELYALQPETVQSLARVEVSS